jgi:hypothetical protein
MGFIKNFTSSFFAIIDAPSAKSVTAKVGEAFNTAKINTSAIDIKGLIIHFQ